MNDDQKTYFKEKLAKWRDSLVAEQSQSEVQLSASNEPDLLDAAAVETDQSIKLASKARLQMMVQKIDQALSRIEEGTYGFCEETGEPIDINRLIARPIATLSIEAQERQEKINKQNRLRVF